MLDNEQLNEAVEYNQEREYIETTADGIPGPKTAEAVAVWQAKQDRLDVDGKVGSRTLEAMGVHPKFEKKTNKVSNYHIVNLANKMPKVEVFGIDVSAYQGTIDWYPSNGLPPSTDGKQRQAHERRWWVRKLHRGANQARTTRFAVLS